MAPREAWRLAEILIVACFALGGFVSARPASSVSSRPVAAEIAGRAHHGLGEVGLSSVPTVIHDALDAGGMRGLRSLLLSGHVAACCGHWQHAAAQQLREHAARSLGLSLRHLGDVHLSNSSVKITAGTALGGPWGSVIVVYLDADEGAHATLKLPAAGAEPDASFAIHVKPHSAVVVPERGELIHAEPRSVAWLHLRHDTRSPRSFVEYYFVAWLRTSFVAPHDTEGSQKFFRTITRHPQYWHGFWWSFIGMFLTIFAMLPLASWALQLYYREEKSHDPSKLPQHRLPTLLDRTARTDGTSRGKEIAGMASILSWSKTESLA